MISISNRNPVWRKSSSGISLWIAIRALVWFHRQIIESGYSGQFRKLKSAEEMRSIERSKRNNFGVWSTISTFLTEFPHKINNSFTTVKTSKETTITFQSSQISNHSMTFLPIAEKYFRLPQQDLTTSRQGIFNTRDLSSKSFTWGFLAAKLNTFLLSTQRCLTHLVFKIRWRPTKQWRRR